MLHYMFIHSYLIFVDLVDASFNKYFLLANILNEKLNPTGQLEMT